MGKTLDKESLTVGRSITLDTETTGFSPRLNDRIVEIGAVELNDGQRTGREFHVYLDPGRPSNPHAMETHGLTHDFLSTQPEFREIAQDLLNFLIPGKATDPAPIWSHNAAFDQRFLLSEFARLNINLPSPFFCSLDISGMRLEEIARESGDDPENYRLHSAIVDARILAHALPTTLWPRC